MENPKEILEKLLKNHDWWYMMSDDPKVYNKGSKEEEAIKLLKDKVGSEYDTLYNKYAPEEFKTMVDYKYEPKNKSLKEKEEEEEEDPEETDYMKRRRGDTSYEEEFEKTGETDFIKEES